MQQKQAIGIRALELAKTCTSCTLSYQPELSDIYQQYGLNKPYISLFEWALADRNHQAVDLLLQPETYVYVNQRHYGLSTEELKEYMRNIDEYDKKICLRNLIRDNYIIGSGGVALAAELGDIETIKKVCNILSETKFLEGNEDKCYAALVSAAKEGHTDIAEFLLHHDKENILQMDKPPRQHGYYTTPYPSDNYLYSPFHEAVVNGHIDMLNLLIKHRCTHSDSYSRAFREAIEANKIEIAGFIMDNSSGYLGDQHEYSIGRSRLENAVGQTIYFARGHRDQYIDFQLTAILDATPLITKKLEDPKNSLINRMQLVRELEGIEQNLDSFAKTAITESEIRYNKAELKRQGKQNITNEMAEQAIIAERSEQVSKIKEWIKQLKETKKDVRLEFLNASLDEEKARDEWIARKKPTAQTNPLAPKADVVSALYESLPAETILRLHYAGDGINWRTVQRAWALEMQNPSSPSVATKHEHAPSRETSPAAGGGGGRGGTAAGVGHSDSTRSR